ncbi:MAG: MarR family transcriptional regulator [bacterium]
MMSRIFNRRIKNVGLTRSQWQVLYLLYQDDGQTQTQLAETLSIAKPPLGKLIDRLEEDDWVERRNDKKDRRAKRVFLTPKVTPLIGPLQDIADEIGRIVTGGMSGVDRKALTRLLHIAHQNLASETDANHD